MLPGFDVCGECGGKGVLGGCRQPCDHVHTFMFCPVCSGVGSVPADATVEVLAQAIAKVPWPGWQWKNHSLEERNKWCEQARAALVAYAQHLSAFAHEHEETE